MKPNSSPRPLLLGHRGAPRLARQNTLAAFAAAMDAGLDGVELDVQRTVDGVLVVHHDPHLPDGRLIAALRIAEVLAAELPDAGRVPTLEATLEWAREAGAYLNVELKSETFGSDGREAETARMLRRFSLAKRLIVSSFNPASLVRFRLVAPEIETALLFDNKLPPAALLHGGRLAPLLGVKALHPRFDLITSALMDRARRHGWRVNAWTVNDPAEARRLLALGVDGLVGDDPAVLLAARDATPA